MFTVRYLQIWEKCDQKSIEECYYQAKKDGYDLELRVEVTALWNLETKEDMIKAVTKIYLPMFQIPDRVIFQFWDNTYLIWKDKYYPENKKNNGRRL
jgi:hypothetical protein